MKRGFTLIELLAVIVILAIIALIVTPLIINVIDEAKKGAFKNTAYGIVKAGEIGYVQDILSGTAEEVTFTYTDGIETSSPSGKTLNYKGTRPQNGTVKINSQGKVALAIHDGNVCAEKGFDTSEVTISTKTVGECIISEVYTWPDSQGYIYKEGIHEDKWDSDVRNDYMDRANSYEHAKNDDHLFLHIDNTTSPTLWIAWVSSEMIDLTDFSRLIVDWAGPPATNYNGYINFSSVQDEAAINYELNESFYGSFARTENEIDISSLEGEFYVSVSALAFFSGITELEIYNIRLE